MYVELISIIRKAIQEQQKIINGQNTKIDGLTAGGSTVKNIGTMIGPSVKYS